MRATGDRVAVVNRAGIPVIAIDGGANTLAIVTGVIDRAGAVVIAKAPVIGCKLAQPGRRIATVDSAGIVIVTNPGGVLANSTDTGVGCAGVVIIAIVVGGAPLIFDLAGSRAAVATYSVAIVTGLACFNYPVATNRVSTIRNWIMRTGMSGSITNVRRAGVVVVAVNV